jgi:PLP dependent protein
MTHNDLDCIKKNLELARSKIAAKTDSNVILMAVTKNRSPEQIERAFQEGCRVFGENRVQEATLKLETFEGFRQKDPKTELHMIGHLQTNKAKEAVEIFDVIQSVDSLKLLAKIHAEAEKQKKPIRIFLQVNVSNDPKKFGIPSSEIFEVLRNAHRYLSSGFIIVDGFMTIVEQTEDPEDRRPFFKKLKSLRDEILSFFPENAIEHIPLRYLSMGMSEDFEIAVSEGANLVRLGRVIFEVGFWRTQISRL